MTQGLHTRGELACQCVSLVVLKYEEIAIFCAKFLYLGLNSYFLDPFCYLMPCKIET